MTERQLGWLSAWHLREDSYGAALARLAEAQHRMPLAARFGDGIASSSDGQNFPLDRRAQATGAINPHKGSEPAVSFYTHVSDRYAPLHSTVISAGASEAAHVLDGLLYHGADLAIERHHTGRIRDQGLQAQAHRASALNLVAGAIVLWNTTYLEAVMRHLEQQGRPVSSHLLQHLSPLGWQHINLTGDYLWTDADIPDGKLRGLRQALRSPG